MKANSNGVAVAVARAKMSMSPGEATIHSDTKQGFSSVSPTTPDSDEKPSAQQKRKPGATKTDAIDPHGAERHGAEPGGFSSDPNSFTNTMRILVAVVTVVFGSCLLPVGLDRKTVDVDRDASRRVVVARGPQVAGWSVGQRLAEGLPSYHQRLLFPRGSTHTMTKSCNHKVNKTG